MEKTIKRNVFLIQNTPLKSIKNQLQINKFSYLVVGCSGWLFGETIVLTTGVVALVFVFDVEINHLDIPKTITNRVKNHVYVNVFMYSFIFAYAARELAGSDLLNMYLKM